MQVKPAAGLIIRDPATMKALPPEGVDVPNTSYWRRRLSDGDVVLIVQKPKGKEK